MFTELLKAIQKSKIVFLSSSKGEIRDIKWAKVGIQQHSELNYEYNLHMQLIFLFLKYNNNNKHQLKHPY